MCSFDKDLKSHVVYELTCNGCKSIYVGQTCRHITTRVAKHVKVDSLMGFYAIECNGDKKNSFPVEDIRPMQQPIYVNDTRHYLYKNTETSRQHARRLPNTRIDTESLVWK